MCWRWDLNWVLNDVKDFDVEMMEDEDRGNKQGYVHGMEKILT